MLIFIEALYAAMVEDEAWDESGEVDLHIQAGEAHPSSSPEGMAARDSAAQLELR